MRFLWILVLAGCATTSLSTRGEQVAYQYDYGGLDHCKPLRQFTASPSGLITGKIGQSEARTRLRNQAAVFGVDILVEDGANPWTGQVMATGFVCD